ncbi:AAA family ATPase [Solibacillus sp. MA9]|uniref:AAA family ATPase n=1 Tax=Solibacillus palustris TaxID=2908203 RepID=A0ABS9U7H8_9BACL|nr:AAA family ATPase [Solibacillus sp. MA9]MCH7320286.1 AAA family ATPase [Solibacillus sp. MA9]
MNIVGVQVIGLLGKFNYSLNLQNEINIIHAPNGSGKTKFLMLIESIINDNFSRIIDIEFEKLIFQFENELIWRIERKEIKQKDNDKNTNKKEFLFCYEIGYLLETYVFNEDEYHLEPDVAYFEIKISKEFNGDLATVSTIIPELRRVGTKTWAESETGETLELKEILDNYGNYEDLFETSIDYDDFFMTEFIDLSFYLPTKLIETNRLYKAKNSKGFYSNTLAISNYSNKIKGEISSILQIYAQTSQDLDQTFPLRLMDRMAEMNDYNHTFIDILNELATQDLERSYLAELGLLDTNESLGEKLNIDYIKNKKAYNKYSAAVLKLFLEDSREKLSVFTDMKERVKIFLKFVNKKLIDKAMKLDRHEGFIIYFKDNEKKKLDKVYQLSSGEQHTIVLLFDLLFQSPKNSLVLIDEPELSLHAAWQMDFLQELREISNITGQKYIVATHSPQIVNDSWELLQELNLPDDGWVENEW